MADETDDSDHRDSDQCDADQQVAIPRREFQPRDFNKFEEWCSKRWWVRFLAFWTWLGIQLVKWASKFPPLVAEE